MELAKEHQIQVDELDLPVASKSDSDDCQDRLSKSRSLTPKNCKRSWIQRSYIIYMHLHPNIGIYALHEPELEPKLFSALKHFYEIYYDSIVTASRMLQHSAGFGL